MSHVCSNVKCALTYVLNDIDTIVLKSNTGILGFDPNLISKWVSLDVSEGGLDLGGHHLVVGHEAKVANVFQVHFCRKESEIFIEKSYSGSCSTFEKLLANFFPPLFHKVNQIY